MTKRVYGAVAPSSTAPRRALVAFRSPKLSLRLKTPFSGAPCDRHHRRATRDASMTPADPLLVGTTDDIPQGEALLVPAAVTGTVPIAVFHAETGKFYALDDRCTHGAASL